MSPITTHVLDTGRGKPAGGVPISLEVKSEKGDWKPLDKGATDADGRAELLASESHVPTGVYRLSFDTAAYFLALNTEGFYPEVRIVFEIREPSHRYHLPLLLSCNGYTTYLGS